MRVTTDQTTAQTPGEIIPRDEQELAAAVAECHGLARTLRVAGGGTRLGRAGIVADSTLTTRAMGGIVTYEPGELTLIAKAGTPVDDIERVIAAEGQALAFEPMDHRVLLGSGGVPTIGGLVAANVSGPRRVQIGACRDHLLGVRFVDGRGRILKNGGRVMKNVTGMDLGKLICGSYGTLGVLTEVAVKTLPVAESQQTLVFTGVSPETAVQIFATALATPFDVSGAAFHHGTVWLRVEGLKGQTDYRRDRLCALFDPRNMDIARDDESRLLWRDLRDVRHFADTGDAVWRILVKPTDAPVVIEALKPLGGEASLDWGGALIWYSGSGDAAAVRRAAGTGAAVLVRPGSAPVGPVFPPESSGVSALTAALRRTFDPAGVFNPGLMGR
ncbi:FAD-binding protein [Paracoccus sp. (in: a-proteobacteria)]|uniref:FAD-binding protein n=1 Tax=Paracoccus sp. TaxID=267 RepID=UPI0026DFDC22|nr:FAD-binding protein [Paracoccus sp. (in: a-proteobacteria)]MDO5646323.1 FAD-binding protein [Paracoccus sp. (in: a-proteobacteria)]